jgi:hypothetical protein
MLVLVIAAALASAHQTKETWVSDGYGLVFEIEGDTLESWEVTKVSCLPSTTATAVPAPPGNSSLWSHSIDDAVRADLNGTRLAVAISVH